MKITRYQLRMEAVMIQIGEDGTALRAERQEITVNMTWEELQNRIGGPEAQLLSYMEAANKKLWNVLRKIVSRNRMKESS